MTLQCWKDLNREEQNAKLKAILESTKEFGSLMPEEKIALEAFFEKFKKTKLKAFINQRSDAEQNEEKNPSNEEIRLTQVVPC